MSSLGLPANRMWKYGCPSLTIPFPSLYSSPSLLPLLPFLSLEVGPLNPARGRGSCKLSSGSGAEPQPKSNLMHFSFKIWHLVATVLMIFLRINWPSFNLELKTLRSCVHLASQEGLGWDAGLWGQNTAVKYGTVDNPRAVLMAILTVRCYASAVLAVIVCLSVCLFLTGHVIHFKILHPLTFSGMAEDRIVKFYARLDTRTVSLAMMINCPPGGRG